MVDFKQMVYVQEKAQYEPRDEVEEGQTILDISGTELRRRLQEGLEIPDWFSFPAVVEELGSRSRRAASQGFTVFFTGLSGSGKSTIANALMAKLMEMGGRPVTLLDGDVVRKHLSSELGFSKEHRDINIQRIGYVASEITKNGGIAICAPIAPYEGTRAACARWSRPTAPSSRCTWRPRSRSASGATARGSTSWRAKARSRSSPASPTPTRRRRPRSCKLETEGNEIDYSRPAGDPEAREHGPDPGLSRARPARGRCQTRAFAYHAGKCARSGTPWRGRGHRRAGSTTRRGPGGSTMSPARTQDEIAAAMGISRQAAQRLVSLAVCEKLVRVWLEHPIARCLELAERARATASGWSRVEVVPSDPGRDGGTVGLAEAGAAEMMRWLKQRAADRHGGRHRAHAQGGGRPPAADRLPAAPRRVADRQRRAGRLGRLLQRDLLHGRGGRRRGISRCRCRSSSPRPRSAR